MSRQVQIASICCLAAWVATVAAQQGGYVYMDLNAIRQERDKAQREWQKTNPDLEAHLATSPKSQVLREIEQSRASAARFSDLDVRYFDSRLKTVDEQLR